MSVDCEEAWPCLVNAPQYEVGPYVAAIATQVLLEQPQRRADQGLHQKRNSHTSTHLPFPPQPPNLLTAPLQGSAMRRHFCVPQCYSSHGLPFTDTTVSTSLLHSGTCHAANVLSHLSPSGQTVEGEFGGDELCDVFCVSSRPGTTAAGKDQRQSNHTHTHARMHAHTHTHTLFSTNCVYLSTAQPTLFTTRDWCKQQTWHHGQPLFSVTPQNRNFWRARLALWHACRILQRVGIHH